MASSGKVKFRASVVESTCGSEEKSSCPRIEQTPGSSSNSLRVIRCGAHTHPLAFHYKAKQDSSGWKRGAGTRACRVATHGDARRNLSAWLFDRDIAVGGQVLQKL